MSCLESFDRLCRKIVSPTRHEINDQDMSKKTNTQSKESLEELYPLLN